MLLPSSDKLRLCALQTHASDPGTKQHSSEKGRHTLRWKCGRQPGKPSLSLGFWDKLPWTAEGPKKKPFSFQRYKLSAQTESVTGTRQKDKKTSVSWGSQSWWAAVNIEWHGAVRDLIPLSTQEAQIQGQFLLGGAFYQKQKLLISLTDKPKNCRGHTGGAGERHSETSQQASVMADRPFPYRHCKTGAFNIVRITSIHRLNLPTANLQRQRHCLCAARQPISHSPSSQHFRHGQQLPAGAECPCFTPPWHPALLHLYRHPAPNDLCKQDCWEMKMSPVLINTLGCKSSKAFLSSVIIYDFLTTWFIIQVFLPLDLRSKTARKHISTITWIQRWCKSLIIRERLLKVLCHCDCLTPASKRASLCLFIIIILQTWKLHAVWTVVHQKACISEDGLLHPSQTAPEIRKGRGDFKQQEENIQKNKHKKQTPQPVLLPSPHLSSTKGNKVWWWPSQCFLKKPWLLSNSSPLFLSLCLSYY